MLLPECPSLHVADDSVTRAVRLYDPPDESDELDTSDPESDAMECDSDRVGGLYLDEHYAFRQEDDNGAGTCEEEHINVGEPESADAVEDMDEDATEEADEEDNDVYAVEHALRWGAPAPRPSVRLGAYTRYTPAVVAAVLSAARPQIHPWTRLFLGLDSFVSGGWEALSVLVLPPEAPGALDAEWAVALLDRRGGFAGLIAARPEAGASRPRALEDRLWRVLPGVAFRRIPLRGVPALRGRHGGLWATAIALWLAKFPWHPRRTRTEGFQYLKVNMTRARAEHALVLGGGVLRATSVTCDVPGQKKAAKKPRQQTAAERARTVAPRQTEELEQRERPGQPRPSKKSKKKDKKRSQKEKDTAKRNKGRKKQAQDGVKTEHADGAPHRGTAEVRTKQEPATPTDFPTPRRGEVGAGVKTEPVTPPPRTRSLGDMTIKQEF